MVNLALRQVLGATVEQCGSVVSGGKLRFDFTYGRPLRTEQVRELDRRVNEMIDRELSVHTGVLELKRAKQIHGIRAVFGEKYPDPVRVVSIGVSVDEIMLDPGSTRWWDYSVELCGGTHLSNTRQAERFVIVEEGSRGAGVHRLVAVTGEECRLAQERARDLEARLEEIKRVSDQAEFNVRVNQFIYDLENSFISVCQHVVLRQRIEELKSQSRRAIVQLNKAAQMKGNTYVSDVLDSLAGCYAPYWVDQLPDGSRESLNKVAKSICDSSKSRLGFDVAVFLFCRDRSNPSQAKTLFVAHVPEGFVVRHSLIARDWVESVSLLLGGKSGGKDQVAQGVSPCAADLQPALDAAAEYARARLA
ncbi:alanine--tRNA ligase, cytoplasmic-like [Schistocerca gregaria]|uniref:alanine--tRNA ligase, cytoplasmic-like n=1 Tax=Schistocerca gregaria TaxID=7010 RepID=UPI00211E237F|nr:alanine--tRNA ligase, cytoplasmic-like [Schistocerca gregaria]